MITIAQYRGRSLVSRVIRLFTRSVWSHSAVILRDDSVIEAWHIGGVSHVESLNANHSPGTEVDIFKISCTDYQEKAFEEFLLSQVGKKYDFRSVWRFVNRVPAFINNQWFCSELIAEGLNQVDIYPQRRIGSSEMSPQLLGISPLLHIVGGATTE